jgi:hypothetical protein
VIQAGVDSAATSTAQYRCWTEDYPAKTVWEGPVIHPGDKAYVYLHYQGNGTTYYFLENVSTGHAQSFTNATPYVATASGDFINERITGYYLPDFSLASVMDNYFGTDSKTHQLTGASSTKFVITSDCTSTGKVLSKPSGVAADGSFTQYWYASRPFTDFC